MASSGGSASPLSMECTWKSPAYQRVSVESGAGAEYGTRLVCAGSVGTSRSVTFRLKLAGFTFTSALPTTTFHFPAAIGPGRYERDAACSPTTAFSVLPPPQPRKPPISSTRPQSRMLSGERSSWAISISLMPAGTSNSTKKCRS